MIRTRRPAPSGRCDLPDMRRGRRDGSAAVEFGLVALPFIMMIFAILEIALIFLTDTVLENAVVDTGRQIRTGEAAGAGLTADQFKARICARMSAFANNCSSRLTVDVRVLPRFRDPPPDPLSGGGFNTAGLTYLPGQPGSIVIVRAWYKQPIFTPFMNQGAPRAGSDGVLTATMAFRNEPYQ